MSEEQIQLARRGADFAYVLRYRDSLVVSPTTYVTGLEAVHAAGSGD